MKLKIDQICPLHRRRDCCGRETTPYVTYKNNSKWERVRMGWRRIRDEHADHPDGYRYRLSKSEMDKVLLQKVKEQNGLCSIGGEPLLDMNDVTPDHILPRGMNGARRDDRPSNIGAACSFHNGEKGSKR